MAATRPDPMARYVLPLAGSGSAPSPPADEGARVHLPESLLVRNVTWFCRLRWLVVSLLAIFGGLDFAPGVLSRVGLRPPGAWPFVAAAALALSNLGFLAHARLMATAATPHRARANLWAQIVADLTVLTLVVHFIGSLETYVAFAYLFHIVLACIFFSRSWSLVVTAVACGLYLACVSAEETGLISRAGIYADAALRGQIDGLPGVRLLNVSWAILTWVVVWYLASHLSALVQERDTHLAETNRRLRAAQRERAQYMLRTTHELKAPFSAIHANVQLLIKGYCGELPPPAQDVLQRVAKRCRRLAAEIQEMLQLANLQSKIQGPLSWGDLDLAEALASCVEQARPVASGRGIEIETDIQPARTTAVGDHMRMLFGNLLSNALTYSMPGGRVRVACAPRPGAGPRVVIEDHGIGIQPEKLPRIFDAYYRTDEAVRHNRESTGLGLAIVRDVVEAHGIQLRVESAPSVGTVFTLEFPPTIAVPGQTRETRETDDGPRDDCGR